MPLYVYHVSASSRLIRPGNLCGATPKDKGECSDKHLLLKNSDSTDKERMIWTCARSCDQTKAGNFIKFRKFKNNDMEIIDLELVKTTYCKPRPPDCSCKTLLGSLLLWYPKINKIDLLFLADPFIVGCKCYLGAAARSGFDNVQAHTIYEKCNKIKLLTTQNYANICKEYKKNKCGSRRWEITKAGTGD